MTNIPYKPEIEKIDEINKLFKAREKLEMTRVIAKKHPSPQYALALKHAIYYLLSYINHKHNSKPNLLIKGKTILKIVLDKIKDYSGTLNSFLNIVDCINTTYVEYLTNADASNNIIKNKDTVNFTDLEDWLRNYSKNKLNSTKKKAGSLIQKVPSTIRNARDEIEKRRGVARVIIDMLSEHLAKVQDFYEKNSPDLAVREKFRDLNKFLLDKLHCYIRTLDVKKINRLKLVELQMFSRLFNGVYQYMTEFNTSQDIDISSINKIATAVFNYFDILLSFGDQWKSLNDLVVCYRGICSNNLQDDSSRLENFRKTFGFDGDNIYKIIYPEFFATYANNVNLEQYFGLKNDCTKLLNSPNNTSLRTKIMNTYKDVYQLLMATDEKKNKIEFFRKAKNLTLTTMEEMKNFARHDRSQDTSFPLFIESVRCIFDQTINALETLKGNFPQPIS